MLEKKVNKEFHMYLANDRLPPFNPLDYSIELLNRSNNLKYDFDSLVQQQSTLESLISDIILRDQDTLRVFHYSLGTINQCVSKLGELMDNFEESRDAVHDIHEQAAKAGLCNPKEA